MWNPNEFTFESGETLFSSLQFLIAASLIHLIVTHLLEKYMLQRSNAINVRRIQRVNNLAIGLYSLFTFILINIFAYKDERFTSWDRLICHRPTPTGIYALLGYLFYLSKLWEFMDIYLVILNKTPILSHFRWHHQTTPSLVLISLMGDLSYDWAIIASNTLLHTFMYPHFAGIWNAGRILLVLGAWQLFVGLGLSIFGLIMGCDGSTFAKLWSLFICISYIVGYLNEHFHLFDRFS